MQADIADDFGALLRRARQARAISQLRLSQLCGVSQRHLSWLETGKALPSRAMVLALAKTLSVAPVLRDRMLLSARHAPVENAGNETQANVLNTLEALLNSMGDVAAVVIDNSWDIHRMNPAFTSLVGDFIEPESVWPAITPSGGQPNLLRLFGDAEALCPYLENGAELRIRILDRLTAELGAGQHQLAEPIAALAAMPKQHAAPGRSLMELSLRSGDLRRRYRAMLLQMDAGSRVLPYRIVTFVRIDPDLGRVNGHEG